MIGVNISANVIESQSIDMPRQKKHLIRLKLYARTSFSPAMPMNTGTIKAERPKHLEIKKYETKAPNGPQLF